MDREIARPCKEKRGRGIGGDKLFSRFVVPFGAHEYIPFGGSWAGDSTLFSTRAVYLIFKQRE